MGEESTNETAGQQESPLARYKKRAMSTAIATGVSGVLVCILAAVGQQNAQSSYLESLNPSRYTSSLSSLSSLTSDRASASLASSMTNMGLALDFGFVLLAVCGVCIMLIALANLAIAYKES
jgi:hypothetical protein